MTDGPCVCGHDGNNHAWSDPTVCKDMNCNCVGFIAATVNNPVNTPMDKYVADMKQMKDRMRWVLQNWKWFRNYDNTELVLAWWKFVNNFNIYNEVLSIQKRHGIDAPESITRARRLLVEQNKEEYGPFRASLIEEKAYKQMGIFEFVIMEKL